MRVSWLNRGTLLLQLVQFTVMREMGLSELICGVSKLEVRNFEPFLQCFFKPLRRTEV